MPDTRAQAYRFILERFDGRTRVASDDQYLRLPEPYRLRRWSPLHEFTVKDFEDGRIAAVVFSGDREPRAGSEEQRARDALRERYPMVAAFPGIDGVTAGPTITVHLGPAQ